MGDVFVLGRPITNVDSAALYALGKLYFDFSTGRAYRYVEGDAALTGDTLAEIQSVSWMDDGWEVTNDISVGLGVVAPAGVAISSITEGAFGWIQVAGQAEMQGDGSVAAGDGVVLDSANDGKVDTMADGEEEQVFGVALEADDASGYFTGMLRGLV